MVQIRAVILIVFATILAAQDPGARHSAKKVFVIASLEGSDGVLNRASQAVTFIGPRWQESRKLMTDDVNAVVDGLHDAGATEVIVLDAFDTGQVLSTLEIHPKAILLSGRPMTPMLEMNSTYAAVVFAGLPAMAGTENGILASSYDFLSIHGIWVNGKPTGPIGARAMLAGHFGVPVIMMYGDDAACTELKQYNPAAECAVVKWGVGRTGLSLAHSAAVKVIREKARQAMDRLSSYKP
jgi:D-amino peptidase